MRSLTGYKAASILFFLNAAIWLLLGIYSLVLLSDPSITPLIIALLMFGNAGAMLLVGWGIARRVRLAYSFGLALLVINILLTFTDQFGLLDLTALLIDLALFGLLIATRRQYTRTYPVLFSKPDRNRTTNPHDPHYPKENTE